MSYTEINTSNKTQKALIFQFTMSWSINHNRTNIFKAQ